MAVDDMYLDNLDEFINDEGRMVTCKWLSRAICVHVNMAKMMLYSFVQKERNEKKNDKLTVTYFVAGVVSDEEGHKVHSMLVVPEEYLDAVKSKMMPLTSCHIYSVQRAEVKDADALYAADYDQMKENIFSSNNYSAIKNDAAKVRSEDEMERLHTLAQPTQAAPSMFNAKPSIGNKSNSSTTSAKQKQNAGIVSMFANQGKKSENTQGKKSADQDVSTRTEPSHPVGKGKAKQSGVMSFFSKPNVKDKEKKSPEEMTSKSEVKEEKLSKDVMEKSDSDKEGCNPQKKRRKIQNVIWDSSSEEEDMDTEEPVPSPQGDLSPAPQEPSLPPGDDKSNDVKSDTDKENMVEQVAPNTVLEEDRGTNATTKRGRRKLESKQVIDEEGFMVTEKVWVVTEASDEEVPAQPVKKQTEKKEIKEPASKTTKKRHTSKTNSKQTNLMSFFKKK